MFVRCYSQTAYLKHTYNFPYIVYIINKIVILKNNSSDYYRKDTNGDGWWNNPQSWETNQVNLLFRGRNFRRQLAAKLGLVLNKRKPSFFKHIILKRKFQSGDNSETGFGFKFE